VRPVLASPGLFQEGTKQRSIPTNASRASLDRSIKSCPKDGHLGSSFMFSIIGMGFSLLDFFLNSLSEDCFCIISIGFREQDKKNPKGKTLLCN
jgi:hypothetical protein